MSSKKDAIPIVPRSSPSQGRLAFDSAVKQNLEVITGRVGTPLKPLPATATLADTIAAYNALLALLQG